jgi:hypothetical protein
MKTIQVWIITGTGGSRIDFIAGWLGCLPNFVNNWWGVDPATGQSVGNMRILKGLDSNPASEISDFFPDDVSYSKDADLIFAGSCHGRYLNSQLTNLDFVKVFYIDVQHADLNKLIWDFFVKTRLSRAPINECRDVEPFFNQNIKKNIIASINHQPTFDNSIILDYTKLFVAGGSRYLSDMINITVDDKYHTHYDNCLLYATSPLEIEVNGKVWRYSDYFDQC